MEEQLISFETAKLAKEKGFDWKCRDWFDNKGDTQNLDAWTWNTNNGNRSDFTCTQPTQSLLQKWLREVHYIYVTVYIMETSEGLLYFDFGIKQIINWLVDKSIKPNNFKTYEKALEEGLQETLKLI